MAGPTTRPRLDAVEADALLVGALAAVAIVASGRAGCAPVGVEPTDLVLTGLFGAAVVALGSRAAPVPLGVGAAVALVAGPSLALRGLALAALGLAGLVATRTGVAPAASAAPAGPAHGVSDGSRATGGPPSSAAHVARAAWVGPAAGLSALLTLQVLLRLPLDDPPRLSAFVAALGVAPIVWSGRARLGPVATRAVRLATAALGLVVLAGVVGGVAVGLGAAVSLRAGAEATDDGLDAVRAGDQPEAAATFGRAADEMARARSLTRAWWALPARHLPVVAQQVHALDAIADGGGGAARLAADGAGRLDADRLRLVDGRLDTDVVAEAGPVLAEVADATGRLHDDLADPGHRSVWLLPPVADGLDDVTEAVGDAEGSARTGALAAALGPDLLGADGPARYFVAFVSPSEARATGFIGNYGVLTVDDGRVELTEVGTNDDLNAAADDEEVTGPPDYLARYARFQPETTWQNVTFTPDGPTAGRVMAELYEQGGGGPVDGVVRIDPTGLARLLRLTGPVEVEGLPYALDHRNVVSFLEVEQYRLFAVAEERSDLLGRVAEGVFDALTTGPGPAPARLARSLGPAVAEGHLSLWMADPAAQELVVRLGADGAAPPVRGDGFGVTTQNAGGGKVDVFLDRTVRYEATVDAATGEVVATATIDLRNDAPASGEPDYLIGNLVDAPTGTNRSWVSIYSPLDLEDLAVDGRSVAVEGERELGRNVWSFFIEIPPGATGTITVSLRGAVDLSAGTYRFDLLPQTMVEPDRVEVAVTFRGGRVAPAPLADGREAPGGVTVAGPTVRATNGDEQGAWGLAVAVERAP